MNNSKTMDRVWSLISNTEALAVNHAWSGKPGTLAKVYPIAGLAPLIENWGRHGDLIGLMAGYTACNSSSDTAITGWKLAGGQLVAPQAGMAEPQCLSTHNYQYHLLDISTWTGILN
jgi:hypothetical protein